MGSWYLTQVCRSQAQGLVLPWLLFLPWILLKGYLWPPPRSLPGPLGLGHGAGCPAGWGALREFSSGALRVASHGKRECTCVKVSVGVRGGGETRWIL